MYAASADLVSQLEIRIMSSGQSKIVRQATSNVRGPGRVRHLSLGLQPKEVPSQLAEISHHLRDAHL